MLRRGHVRVDAGVEHDDVEFSGRPFPRMLSRILGAQVQRNGFGAAADLFDGSLRAFCVAATN